MSIIYNLGSLILGLAAWAVLLMGLARRRTCAGLSFALCAASLLLQLREIANRVQLRDFSAIEDTLPAVAFAATVLVIGTVVLNAAAAAIKKYRDHK